MKFLKVNLIKKNAGKIQLINNIFLDAIGVSVTYIHTDNVVFK